MSPLRAAIIAQDDFDNSILWSPFASSGFSVLPAPALLTLNKADGAGDGQAALFTNFTVDGDFTATVRATNIDLSSDATLGMGVDLNGNFSNIFLFDTAALNATIFLPTFSSQTTPNSSAQVLLRVRRVGATVLQEFDNGSGFQLLQSRSDPAFRGAARVTLFLGEGSGNPAPLEGQFDQFVLSTPDVPEPSTWGLLLAGSLVLGSMQLRRHRLI